MSSISDAIVPGVGPIPHALSTIAAFCNDMEEATTACESLHGHLVEIYEKTIKPDGRVHPLDAVDKFVGAVAAFSRYLQRYRGKKLVFRVVEHWAITEELLQLNQDIAALFPLFGIAMADNWKEDWEDDVDVQKAILTAMVRDNAVVLRDLQDPRTQAEAVLTLRFEAEHRAGRHGEDVMRLIKSLLATATYTLGTSKEELPPWFMPSYEVRFEPNPFARGSFGSVHHGVWGPGTKVVVKCFTVDDVVIDEHTQRQIEKEMNIWHMLNHPNVAKMFGASHVSSPPFIVCEDATNGNLRTFLTCSDSSKMWRLLYQAALGLDYIHKQGIVHGDLKLNNILVGADGQAKVADFGLSTLRTCSTLSKTGSREALSGGLRWRAPECLKARPTFASDVYSLAMCMIEAAIGEPPFAFLDDDSVRENLRMGEIPARPDAMSDDAWGLILAMTNADPTQRMPLKSVIEKVNELAENEAGDTSKPGEIICTACSSTMTAGSRFCAQCGAPSTPPIASVRTASITTSTGGVQQGMISGMGSNFDVEGGGILEKKAKGTARPDVQNAVALLQTGANLQKENAAQWLANLAADYTNRAQIVAEGSVQAAIALLRTGNELQKQYAAQLLANLATDDANCSGIVNEGVSMPAVALLKTGTDLQKRFAARLLANLATNYANRTSIVKEAAIKPAVAMLKTRNELHKRYAAQLLAKLSVDGANCTRIVEEDAVKPIISLLQTGDELQRRFAAQLLANLATGGAHLTSFVDGGLIKAAVAMLRARNELQKLYAAQLLAKLATDDASCSAIVSEGAVKLTVAMFHTGGDLLKQVAAQLLAKLTTEDANRVDGSVIKPALALLEMGNELQKQYATVLLANLATDDSKRASIVEEGVIKPAVALLHTGNKLQKQHVARLLANLAIDGAYRSLIVDEGAIKLAVALLHTGTGLQQEYPALLLANLAADAAHRPRIVGEGAIKPAVALLHTGTEVQKELAARLLAYLALDAAHRVPIVGEGAITSAVALLRTGNEPQKEDAAHLLANLAFDDAHRAPIVSEGAINPAVALLHTGTEPQKEYATHLLDRLGVAKADRAALHKAMSSNAKRSKVPRRST